MRNSVHTLWERQSKEVHLVQCVLHLHSINPNQNHIDIDDYKMLTTFFVFIPDEHQTEEFYGLLTLLHTFYGVSFFRFCYYTEFRVVITHFVRRIVKIFFNGLRESGLAIKVI